MKNRFIFFSALTIIAIALLGLWWKHLNWLFIIIIPLVLLGIYDLFQTRHAILRNFPVIGHMRYTLESLRPEIHQYFIETDTGGRPFDRLARSQIYRRAKKLDDTMPFGTQNDVYREGYEWLSHSIAPLTHDKLNEDPRVLVGGPECTQPYSASVLNISAMSFGSLSKNAVLALNAGAKIGNFAHNTGEGSISDHHLEPGGDIIWQIGTGYFGCRKPDGSFNEDAFRERATLPQVKMIEIKLSQGAKPGHGGILPASKVNAEIARIRLVEQHKDVVSPPAHTAFANPTEMMHFIRNARKLSGGKPVGFKLCVGHPEEFVEICKAIVDTGIYPDFITIDGGEGGTGAAPMEFSDSVGLPLRDALVLVLDMLTGYGIRKHIRVIASGRITNGFDMIKCFALGADMCNSARGMMMALGCIQALECNKNTCPTGVATQNKYLMSGLVVNDKKTRVAHYHHQTVKSAVELMGAAGISHPDDLQRHHIHRRLSPIHTESYAVSYPYIPEGSLRSGEYPKKYYNLITPASAN